MTIDREFSDESAETTENASPLNELEYLQRRNSVEKTIRNHIATASAIGLIPVPLLDMAALIAVQANLIRKTAKAYDVPFATNKVKMIVASLISAVLPTALTPVASSLGKAIPFVGQTAGVVTMPILAGAATYATGRVFAAHFESGGTFLNFDVEKAKEPFARMFKEGKKVVGQMKPDEDEKVAAECKVTDAIR